MTSDLGVWTASDCALVLIDYQKEMFEVIRSETDADQVELNVRLLCDVAAMLEDNPGAVRLRRPAAPPRSPARQRR